MLQSHSSTAIAVHTSSHHVCFSPTNGPRGSGTVSRSAFIEQIELDLPRDPSGNCCKAHQLWELAHCEAGDLRRFHCASGPGVRQVGRLRRCCQSLNVPVFVDAAAYSSCGGRQQAELCDNIPDRPRTWARARVSLTVSVSGPRCLHRVASPLWRRAPAALLHCSAMLHTVQPPLSAYLPCTTHYIDLAVDNS
jgi:hypothetical protein